MRSTGVFTVKATFLVYIALSVLILPLKFVLGWILAATIHELCHILMMRILGVKLISVSLCASGAIIETGIITPFQECLCAIAGPLGGFLLLPFARVIPLIAMFAVIQSMYNLMPVSNYDGGRVLKYVLCCICGERNADAAMHVILIVYLLLVFTAYLCISNHHWYGYFLPVILLMCIVPKNSLHCMKNNSTITNKLKCSEVTYR